MAKQTKQSDLAAKVNHPDHPQWVKESLIEDESDWYRASGLIPPMREIESGWIDSLNRLDRKPKSTGLSSKRQPSKRAQQAAGNMSDRFTKVEQYQERKAAELRNRDKVVSPREKKLRFRLSVLMRHGLNKASNTHEPLFPTYAKRILNVWARCKRDYGVYAGKTYAEKGKISYTELEQIANDSNRWLGEWNR